MTFTVKQRRLARSLGILLAFTTAAAVAGCGDIDVENLNGTSIEGLLTSPTPSAVNSAAQGLMSTWRGTSASHASTLTKYGFEIWQIRASNPPSLTQIVSFPQTGGFWGYGGIKNINVLLKAADVVAGMTDAQKNGIRGWAKTNLAVQYEDMAQAHDTFGIVLDLPNDPLTEVPPIATKAAVWTRIYQLLDDADQDLSNAGTAFSFTLGPGFVGFNNPTTFRQVNRALKARYQIINQDFAGALTTLNGAGTFINTAGTGLTRTGLLRGPYHTYTTLTGDGTNGLSGTDYYINNRILNDAQLKTVGGARDDRVALKTRTVTSFTFQGVTSTLKHNDFLISPPVALTNVTSLPIIRNEELILLRAEAKLATGDPSGAIADINLIRVNSAGLPPISDPYVAVAALNQPPTLLEELLYEKRMSLWGEIGTVWLDMRRYSMIGQIPRYDPSFKLFDIFPIPQAECEVRGYSTKGCFSAGYNGI